MLATIFKPKTSADERPAATALHALRTRIATLQTEDTVWSDKEASVAAEDRRYERARQELEQLEGRLTAALADRELNASSADDPQDLERRVQELAAHVHSLERRHRVNEQVLVRIRAERQRIRTELTTFFQQLAAHQHAALVEHLRALAPEFLAAERVYLDALARVYGASRLADRIAREQIQQGRPHLGWTGDLNAADIFTPRPATPDFAPVPQRPDINSAIEAEAERLRKEFS